jgi:hypothetical protein
LSPHDVFTPFIRRFTDEHSRSIKDTRALYNRVTAKHRGSRWGRAEALDRTAGAIMEAVAARVELPEYEPLCQAIAACVRELLALETTVFSNPAVDFSEPLSLREQVDLNHFLRAKEYFLAHEERVSELLIHTVGNVACAVVESAPILSGGAFSVPLISLVPKPGWLVGGLVGIFFEKEQFEAGLFAELRDQLHRNLCAVSGIPTDSNSKKPLLWPSEARMEPEDLVDAYLSGTPLHALLSSPCPFALPDEQRFSGHWIIAPPGRGKTTLLHSLIVADLDKDAAIVLMDSKGDLIEPVKNLAAIKDRLLLIEPNPDFAFALNPLDIGNANPMHAVALIEYIMAGLLDAKFTALQSTLFRNVVPAIIEGIPNPTLDTFKQVMTKGLPTEPLAKVNPHAQEFFTNRETGFNAKTYESTRKEVVWRLDYLLTNPVLRSMFSAAQTKLDMSKEMDAGKVIIINNSKAMLGDEGAEFFGRFFIALILRAAQQRAGKSTAAKKACFVYIDECQSVISKDAKIPTLLDECRSQKIALILAHQRTAQLTAPVLDAVANSAIRMANSDDEAKYLSPKLRMDTEVLQALPRGTFGTFVRDLTSQGIQLKVAKSDLGTMPQMTAEERSAIRERMRSAFSSPVPPPPQSPAPPSEQASSTPAIDKADDPGEPSDTW